MRNRAAATYSQIQKKRKKWPATRGVGDNLIHRTALLERPREKKRANNIFNYTDQHRGWIPQLPAQQTLPETLRAAPGALRVEAGYYYLSPVDPMRSAPGSRIGPPLERLNRSVAETPSPNPCRPAASPPLPPPSEDSLVPEIFNNSRANERGGGGGGGGGCLMTQTVTNPLVQMACERRAGTTRVRSCPGFRLRRPWLLTNLDGFWF